MRSLPQHIEQELQDAAYELPNLPDGVLVKDAHLTEALRLIAGLPRVEQASLQDTRRKDVAVTQKLPIDLVFAGGTCLSKAHGTIKRMSEDIDFKVHLREMPEGYKAGQLVSVESRLRAMHKGLETLLVNEGFSISKPVTSGVKNPLVRDSRRYYELELDYAEPHNEEPLGAQALRSALKLELMAQADPIPHEVLKVGYLHRQLLGIPDPDAFEIPCISRDVTLAEKVLSFLRRYAWELSGNHRGPFDTALVRHVYDTWRMTEEDPLLLARAKGIFQRLAVGDAFQFGTQYPAFKIDPMGILRQTLKDLPQAQINDNFNARLVPLVYVEMPPFDEIYQKFCVIASEMLS